MLFLLIIVFCIHAGKTHTNECTPPFHHVGNQCLYFGALILEDYESAKAVCQSLGGHLARITEPQQFKDIVDYIKENDFGDASYCLDGNDITQEGQWIYSNGRAVPMGTPYWQAWRDSSSGNWHHEPNNKNGDENCLELDNGYHLYFNDYHCNEERSILCEENFKIEENRVSMMEISCPPLFVPVSGLCLAFLTFADETWAEARQTCSSLGGQLANITQPQHLRDIYLYVNQQDISDSSFWIGGSDQENEGAWLFTDGSAVPLGTPFWGSYRDTGYIQEPNGGTLENCLVLVAPGQYYFRDAACDILYNPLCSINPL